jgi:hypothetical protein
MLTKWELEQKQKQWNKVAEKWGKGHPEYIPCSSNTEAMVKYIEKYDLAFTELGLELAFQALLKSGDVLIDRSKVHDPDEPETRVGYFRNGMFYPEDLGGSRGTVRTAAVGQHTPGTPIGDDIIIKKNPQRMTAAEYAEACRISRSFRDRENAKR